ncbi:IPT/TIG domain-containing protein [Gracilimonas sp. Q87]|uniref:IPT/TIG domain-containing protein n=1 Tax=Gracilimonas sp. Q87 TaxID=3384766 RepID=UPI0039845279
MKKLTVYFFAIAALLLLFKAGCSDINRTGVQDQVEGIKSVVPAQGPYGARVLIGGKGFTNDPEVLFNGVQAEIESANDSTILTRVPLEANTGPVEVIAGQDILSGPTFTIDSTRSLFLIIDEIRPSTGRYRDTMYIAGSGFDPVPEENEVYLNEIRSAVLESSDSLLVTTVPYASASGLIMVVANQDTAIGPRFELLRHQITDIDPTSGRVGTQVRINGLDFSDQISENSVFFNGVQAEILESSTSQILTSVPLEATSGPVSVAVRRDTVEGPTFSVQELQILEVAPLSGEVGTDVLISGNGFSPNIEENTIQFNGVEAPVLSASETELQTQVPEGATNGIITVIVNGVTVTGPEFIVEIGAPVAVIESFCLGLDCGFTGTSSSDPDGEIVSYDWNFGDGFTAKGDTVSHTYEAEGSYDVELVVTDDSGKTDTTVQPIDVVLPQITAIDPISGPIGTEVTITGTGFSDIAGGNAVGFTSGETIVAGEIVSESTTQLVAVVPTDATTGPVYVAVGENYITEGPVFTVEQTSEPKTLEVVVSTDGPAGDGYTLSVTGQDARFVEPNSSTLYTGILENEVSVELTGLGNNCTVDGENPRLVNLNNPDNAGFTAFNVTCTGPAPTIENITPVSGTTGTQVTITGSNFSATASENIVTFNGARAELNSASATELVAFVPFDATTGPVEVTVNGQTATGPTFTVITTGRLEVNISTTGTSIDPDGYGLILDGGAASAVNVNDFVAYDDLSEGSHSIELTDIASNCFITQDRTNPYDVSVTAGDTTVTNIDVQCDALAPDITGISPTSGTTGTQVTITGSNFSATASENDVQFNGVRAELNSASSTQLVAFVPASATTGPVTVTVNGQTATGPTFTVITTGTVEVSISTTGVDLDPDGYNLYLDKGDAVPVGINDLYTYSSVPEGSHTLELTDIAANCTISNGTPNPNTFEVIAGQTSQINYALSCEEIIIPEKILFRDDEVYMMDPDGANVVPLTKTGDFLRVKSPVLSNDGSRIVYMELGDIPNIVIMNSDGSNAKKFQIETFSSPRYPAWSPDDQQIVFVGTINGSSEIFVMNSDGTNLTQITKTENINEDYVHWSPVSNEILISYREQTGTYTYEYGLILMNGDGSNRREITQTPGIYSYGRISPNGKEIIYTDRPGDCFQIFRMNIDGSNIRALTSQNELNCEVINGLDWSPDGSQIVLQSRPSSTTDSEISIMPSDGSASPKIISNTPSHPASLSEPTWGIFKK